MLYFSRMLLKVRNIKYGKKDKVIKIIPPFAAYFQQVTYFKTETLCLYVRCVLFQEMFFVSKQLSYQFLFVLILSSLCNNLSNVFKTRKLTVFSFLKIFG